jgi:two-component system sensor histidine kinase UhpB
MLETSLAAEHGAELRARLTDSSALVESTVDSIENVMAELRPPMLDDYGLLPALQWYAKHFSKRTGVEVTVSGSDAADRLAPEMEITFFRIAQEALTNVAKHARAGSAEIVLEHSATHCLMSVTDDGIGLERTPSDTERRPRLGMVTMRERAQAVGASFLVRTVPGGGTQVAVSVP